MLSRIKDMIERLLDNLLQPQPVPVPVTRHESLPGHVRRALQELEERHDRGEISDAEYVRQLERLTGR